MQRHTPPCVLAQSYSGRMSWAALSWIAALISVSTALGLLWRWRVGRAVSTPALTVNLADIPAGARVTLLQFSTAMCSSCPPTRRLLGDIAADTDGVQHVEIDLTTQPALADRFGILQTPTTFLVDAAGVVHARIGGAPRPGVVQAALAPLLDRSR